MSTLTISTLTSRESLFCQAISRGNSRKQAAIEAGWSASTAGRKAAELLRRADIQNYIDELKKQAEILSLVTVENIIAHLSKIAFADAQTLYELTEDPEAFRDTAGNLNWPEDMKAAITGVKVTRTTDSETGETTITRHFQRCDQFKALKLLGNYTGALCELNQALATLAVYGVKIARVDGRWQVIDDSGSLQLPGEEE